MALRGIRVIEMSGLAPAPFAGLVLADLGADVIRVDRASGGSQMDVLGRGKRSIAINLKDVKGVSTLKRLCAKADVLIEPYRPGVMEKLGLGPDTLIKANPALIYARLTGYGQTGPYALKAGHDINYIGLSGTLSRIGRYNEPPLFPVNMLADFAGGGLICALGVLAALNERHRTGKGQVIDSNMVEGAAYIASWLFKGQNRLPIWGHARGRNMLDSGAHFYETYETKDGKFMSVGAIEPQFYADLLKGLEMTAEELPQYGGDVDECKAKMRRKFKEKTRDEWCEHFEHLDACIAPVLDFDEVNAFPHNAERGAFAKDPQWDNLSPIPAPRLSNHEGSKVFATAEAESGNDTKDVLAQVAGFAEAEIEALIRSGAVVQTNKAKL